MSEFDGVDDWDDAYANRDHIPDAEDFIVKWEIEAKRFRDNIAVGGQAILDVAYGASQRQYMDVFEPAGAVNGTIVFVHGGYWRAFDKSYWSHFAKGAVKAGWRFIVPSYDLCPEVSITEIVEQIGTCITCVSNTYNSEIALCGHSAGGHLVTKMMCEDTPLREDTLGQIEKVTTISGVHDLRPLLRTKINEDLKLSVEEADAQSPVLWKPIEGLKLTCVVGSDERPEFIRQNALLANVWRGLGARTREIVVPRRHHFNVVEPFAEIPLEWIG